MIEKEDTEMRRWIPVVLSVGLLSLTALAAEPIETPDSPTDVLAQLAQLNATLREIADLLERQISGQDLDLVMKRIQLTATRADQTEAQLRRAEGERVGLEDEMRRMNLHLETLTTGMGAEDPEQIEAITRQMTGEMEILDARLKDVQGRIAELQARLAAERVDQREWQAFLDRRLGQL